MEDYLTPNLEKLALFVKLAERIEGKTKFQKLIFLGKQEHNLPVDFDFKLYNYGPYSFRLSDELDVLYNLGILDIKIMFFESNGEFEGKKITYSLTAKGQELVGEIKDKYPDFISQSKEVISKWNGKSLNEIIQYVYSKYVY